MTPTNIKIKKQLQQENMNMAKTIPNNLEENLTSMRKQIEEQYGKGQMLYKDFGFSEGG